MSDEIAAWVQDVHCGDATETLDAIPESSIHCVITSPPYYGLRNYNVEGQIGLEETLDEYIQKLVDVGDAIRRVLRPDGNWWLNIGDSYASKPRGNKNPVESTGLNNNEESFDAQDAGVDTTTDMQPKQKMLVPHRVAIALQDAGWIVRNDVVWRKPNPMPEPVKDRLSTTFEYVFHLTPQPDYYYDLNAIREPHTDVSLDRAENAYDSASDTTYGNHDFDAPCHPNGKNPGDVFEVSIKPFPEAHFAVYPEELPEKPIKATCPPQVCADCGAPYERDTTEQRLWERDPEDIDRPQASRAVELADDHGLTDDHMAAARAVNIGDSDGSAGAPYDRVDDKTERLAREVKDALGAYYREFAFSGTETTASEWAQQCECATGDTQSGIVLDPFAGAGTTCLVAKRLDRRFIGIELNEEYVALAQKRVGLTVDNPDFLLDEGEQPLTAFDSKGET